MSKRSNSGEQPMEGYVDQIGVIKPKDVKQYKQAAGTVLKELNQHTQNISQLEKERRAENQNPHANGVTDQGWCSREKLTFYALVVKCIVSGVLFPIFDIGSDIVTAATHLSFGDWSWGILTFCFVLLPGFTCGLAIMIKGLKSQRVSKRRIINYTVVLLVMPFLFPICVVLVNLYMVYLMILNRSKEIISIMGHDVKQFKALEGFLESGPQFVLQTYILLTDEKHTVDKDDTKRILVLLVSITLSFFSLAKAGFNVNVPDPDENRTSMQYPESAPRFKITSAVFHLVVVLFRVTSLAVFFACFTEWTILIILASFAINFVIFHISGASNTMTLLLGAVSIFMPNGYLLYNFAATFPVDFDYKDTRRLLRLHMLSMTPVFMAILLLITVSSHADWLLLHTLTEDSVLQDPPFTIGLCVGLMAVGILSVVTYLLHWKLSVKQLYHPPELSPEQAAAVATYMEEEENGGGEGVSWLKKAQFWKKRDSTTEC